MIKLELKNPTLGLLLTEKINKLILISTNLRKNNEVVISGNIYLVETVENYTISSAPDSLFKNIGLKSQNKKYKNYNHITKKDAYKVDYYHFECAKISWISLIDFQQTKYTLTSPIQLITIKKIN